MRAQKTRKHLSSLLSLCLSLKIDQKGSQFCKTINSAWHRQCGPPCIWSKMSGALYTIHERLSNASMWIHDAKVAWLAALDFALVALLCFNFTVPHWYDPNQFDTSWRYYCHSTVLAMLAATSAGQTDTPSTLYFKLYVHVVNSIHFDVGRRWK